MSYRHNQHIYSPSFQEMAFRKLKNSTAEERENLSTEELKIFKNEYTIQKFCKEEMMERVLYILTRLGKSWTLRVEEDQFDADMVEFNSIDQYQYPLKRVDITEATSRAGVCVISSRDVMTISHMVAQNCNTKVYALSEFSQALVKKGRDLGQLKSWDREVERSEAAHDVFNDLLLEQLNSFTYAADTLGLSANDIRILSALYKKRNGAIKMSDISTLTKSTGKKKYFRPDMQKMLDEGLVVSDQKETKKIWANSSFFMITTKGIDRIMKYREYVAKNAFGI